MRLLGERQVIVDCDVLQADGGTRTASICGGYIALHDARQPARAARDDQEAPAHPSRCAAISVGIIDGAPMLDLPYVEDVDAEVDMNVVMIGRRAGSSRCREPPRACAFTRSELDVLLGLAEKGISEIIALQDQLLADAAAAAVRADDGPRRSRPRRRPTRTRPRRSSRSLGRSASSCCRVRRSVPEVIEDADTLEGNARLKAAAIATATGVPALADDTGLEVDVLGGAPGVHTARYAGRRRDLRRQRHAAARGADGHARPSSGLRASHRRDGVLARRARGGRRRGRRGPHRARAASAIVGFGYDPVFMPDEGDGRTFAEMRDAEKHGCRHRGPSAPGARRRRSADLRADLPAPEVDRPRVDHVVAAHDVHALVQRHRRVDVRRGAPDVIADAQARCRSLAGRRSCARPSRTRPWRPRSRDRRGPSRATSSRRRRPPSFGDDRDDGRPHEQRLAERKAEPP